MGIEVNITPADRILELLNDYPVNGKAVRTYRAKSDGGRRAIAMPNEELNKWLKTTNRVLRQQFNSWPAFMHGGIKGRSYVSHARPHVDQRCVITVDIRDCFGSITTNEVAEALRQHLKLPQEVSIALADKLCFRGKLAQGFSTSNYISNLCLLVVLKDLHKELKRLGIVLTNYVDDIAISGAIKDKGEAINLVAHTLSCANFAMKKAKVAVMPASRRQVVCGLVVNKRVSLSRDLKRRLLSRVADSSMSALTAEGWVANLKNVDEVFMTKFHKLALSKGILRVR